MYIYGPVELYIYSTLLRCPRVIILLNNVAKICAEKCGTRITSPQKKSTITMDFFQSKTGKWGKKLTAWMVHPQPNMRISEPG
jgi:hypothetical protein